MIRSASFGFNVQTADTNAFQNQFPAINEELNALAQLEFDIAVDILKNSDIEILVIQDTDLPIKPDAIFPNNWISFHSDGTAVLYPMLAENRRWERRQDIVESFKQSFEVYRIIDLTNFEIQNKFLEGTGSIVFDHKNRKAYACISSRTNPEILEVLCNQLDYTAVMFEATDSSGQAIYHTNVMLCIGNDFAVVCLESIADFEDQLRIKGSLSNDGLECIEISRKQMLCFAGNMLQVINRMGVKHLILSQTALNSLDQSQKERLAKYGTLTAICIPTIETIGGGSARCMLAEVFLSKKT